MQSHQEVRRYLFLDKIKRKRRIKENEKIKNIRK